MFENDPDNSNEVLMTSEGVAALEADGFMEQPEEPITPTNSPDNGGYVKLGSALRNCISNAVLESEDAAEEAAEILDEAQYTPGIESADIPREVLDELLPGEDVVVLPKVKLENKPVYSFIKRTFDITACLAALLVLAIPMVAIACKVKLDSPGPVIYAQRRLGKDGRVFEMYKFRSMYLDAEAKGARWAAGDDPRVTPFGRFMRKTRLDEIPQFWNVVKGDMSLIGPRPERPAFAQEFEKRIVGFNQRTLVRPGLSGLAQVTGGYELLPKDKVLYDLEYMENRSLWLDTKLMAATVSIVFSGRGAR